MSLILNMLSSLVTTFLPRSKHLLISRLQSPSAVILELQKIKSDTVSTVSPSIATKFASWHMYADYYIRYIWAPGMCLSALSVWLQPFPVWNLGSVSLSKVLLFSFLIFLPWCWLLTAKFFSKLHWTLKNWLISPQSILAQGSLKCSIKHHF